MYFHYMHQSFISYGIKFIPLDYNRLDENGKIIRFQGTLEHDTIPEGRVQMIPEMLENIKSLMIHPSVKGFPPFYTIWFKKGF